MHDFFNDLSCKKSCTKSATFVWIFHRWRLCFSLVSVVDDLFQSCTQRRRRVQDCADRINPQHQIPVFVDDDGEVYIDSHAIMCFMVSKYANDDSLYPKDIKIRAHVDHFLHFENGVLFQVIKDIVARNIYGGEGEFNSKTLEMCHNAYSFLECYLSKGKYVVGNNMTVADVSINTTLITLDELIPVTKEKYPNTCAWMDRMKCLPGYDDINVPGALALCARINGMMEQHRAKVA